MRQHVLGSSDAASVVGLGRESRFNLWHRIVARDIDEPERGGLALAAGKLFEDPLAKLIEMERPDWRLERAGVQPLPGEPRIGSSPDFLVLDRESGNVSGIAELKVTGSRTAWGDPGSREVPPPVLVQVRHQSAVARRAGRPVPVVYVCALFLPGWDLGVYPVEPDAEAEEALLAEEVQFLDGPEPDPTTEAEIRRRWSHHDPGKVVRVPAAALDEYESLCANVSGYETLRDAKKAELLALIQDGEIVEDENGRQRYTYRTNRAFDSDLLRSRFPALADEFTVPAIDTTRLRRERKAFYEQSMRDGAGPRVLRRIGT